MNYVEYQFCQVLLGNLVLTPLLAPKMLLEDLRPMITIHPEWDKVWSRLSSHLQPFLSALCAYFKIFRQKYRILTYRDKRESYFIVLQQNNV